MAVGFGKAGLAPAFSFWGGEPVPGLNAP